MRKRDVYMKFTLETSVRKLKRTCKSSVLSLESVSTLQTGLNDERGRLWLYTKFLHS